MHHSQNTTFTSFFKGSEALFASPHRFGFNGKERVNEIKGEGGQQDYEMRIYDTIIVIP